MGSDANGTHSRVTPEQFLDTFALVIYVPDPLCRFLDGLRRELDLHYNPHAHVSVLPPRTLDHPDLWAPCANHARELSQSFPPFRVEAAEVAVFPVTDVVYLELGAGSYELRAMHELLNSGPLAFEEPFAYHPHITLAQEVAHECMAETVELARRRWREYTGKRAFVAARAAFVRNTTAKRWIDLAEFPLGYQSVLV